MKRMIKASEEFDPSTIQSNKDIVEFLNSKGIDTTMNKYELSWTFFNGIKSDKFRAKFSCPGDYLALFSTSLAGFFPEDAVPNFKNIDDIWGIDYFVKTVNDNPTYESLYRYGSSNEWYLREDFIEIKLVNVTTGRTLAIDPNFGKYDRVQEYEGEW